MTEQVEAPDISPEEKAHVARWEKWIKAAKEERKEFFTRARKHRRYARGLLNDDDDKMSRTNLIYSTLATMLPRIYAKNPEIAVNPAPSVDPELYPVARKFAETLRIVVQRELDRAQLKKRMKAAVRAAQITAIGWLKVSYQRDKRTDPIILQRLNDTQDNLQRIEHLLREVEAGAECGETEAQRDELKHQVEALQRSVEVSVAEGLCIDLCATEDVLVDAAARSFDTYTEYPLAMGVWYSKDQFAETFGRSPDAVATEYLMKGGAEATETKKEDRTKAKYRVWEIWDKASSTIYTVTEGESRWTRPPFQPEKVGERWHALFALAYNLVDGQFEPMSDVELLQELQKEYEYTRNKFAEHREKSVPHWIADSDMDERDIKRKVVADLGEIVLVDGKGRPLSEVFQAAQTLPVKAELYDVTQIRADAELVSGVGDAARGTVQRAKTLGEAEILESSLATRTGERQDVNEDLIKEITEYGAEILLQELTDKQAQRIAGPGAAWPTMQKRDVFELVSIEIRAGTSGKPNKQREQQQWLQLMPELRDLIRQVHDLRRAGDTVTANSLIEVAKETLRRFDERLDIEQFLPDVQKQQPNQNQNAQSQLNIQMLQEELKKLQAQVRETNSKALNNEIDARITAHHAVNGPAMTQVQQ